ncbi:MAG: hypothetical protein ABW168_11545 [Sedimenticola sp.]
MSTNDVTAQAPSQQSSTAQTTSLQQTVAMRVHAETSEVAVEPEIGNPGCSQFQQQQQFETEIRNNVSSLQTSISQLSEKLEAAISRNRLIPPCNQPAVEGTGINFDMLGANIAPETCTRSLPVTDTTTTTQFERYTFNVENARSTFGYAAELLPFVETVHPSIRRQIQEGGDVNLATLLIPYYHSLPDQSKEKVDPRLHTVLNISQFVQAFGIYKNIMCQAHPNRRVELDLYERDIIDMATRYGEKGFYEYHKVFSAQAAANLKFNNIKVDWSIRNNRLFCSIFTNYRANSCTGCGSTLHMSSFCPTIVSDSASPARSGSHAVGFGPVNRQNTNFAQSFGRYNASSDMHGRARTMHNGQEICNNFNTSRGCASRACRNSHICLTCKQTDHARINCSGSKNFQGQKIPSLR